MQPDLRKKLFEHSKETRFFQNGGTKQDISTKKSNQITLDLLTFCLVLVASVAATAAEPAENPIIPTGAELELLHTRQAKLNSGLTEGPAAAPDGSIYFTDMPFGKDNGMILRFDPRTRKTSVFANNSGKSNGLAFDADGNLLSCDGADGGSRSVRRWNLKTGESEVLADRYQGKRFNSPNDLCVDVKGRVYFAELYRLKAAD